jgi:hypothetical protein
VNPTKNEQRSFGKFFVNGNIVEGSKKVTQNNLLGVHMEASNQDKMNTITSQPFEVIAIPNENAAEAFLKVLDKVGASFKRDTLDQRIIEDVIKRRGKIIDVQGGFPHGTPFEQTLIAWPTLKMGTVLVDSDQDGIPDVWEKAQGLDPKNALDAQHFNLLKEYSNLEVYINSILVDAKFN